MKKTFLLLLPAILLIFSSQATVHAQSQQVEVGIYVISLGKFEVSTGAFTIDFYLSLKCSEECDPTGFEFMNGRANSIDKIIDEPNEKFYRIQANLINQVDLKKFPFDNQKMQIILEDKKKTIEELEYAPAKKESGLDKSIIFTGWNIDGWNAETKKHFYPVYDETYSQYAFTINISRIAVNSFLKTLLPVLFIIIIVLFSFILDPDKVTTRLAMTGSALVAAVMFHVSISNQIPPVGYLTFADKFMALSYLILMASFVINIALIELIETKKTELAEKIHRRTEYSMFIIVPILYIILFLFFL